MVSATYGSNAFEDDWIAQRRSSLRGSLATKLGLWLETPSVEQRRPSSGSFRQVSETGGPTNVISSQGEWVRRDFELDAEEGCVSDQALAAIRSFSKLSEGWDGHDAKAPTEAIIGDALAVARSWPADLGEPAAEPDSDGHISLSGFDRDGMISLAIDFIGEGRATYAVLAGPSVLVADKFNPRNQTSVIRTLERARQLLGEV